MFKNFLPFLFHKYTPLKDAFAKRAIIFGMAGEYLSFDSTVQAPLILKHAASFTPEVSMKMENTQPVRNIFTFSYADSLVDRAKANGIRLHGHCGMWHLQNPPWLWDTLSNGTKADGYEVLYHHIRNLVSHYSTSCASMDVVNEYGAVMEGVGWGKYLGRPCVDFAFETARQYAGNMKLYYNSFFDSEEDIDLAISLLQKVDGIGIQLHLVVGDDIEVRFERLRRLIEACRSEGKNVRFSECTALKTPDGTLEDVAIVWGRIVRFALEYPFTVTALTQWGVKYPAWGYRHVLFDSAGNYTLAYKAVMKELNR